MSGWTLTLKAAPALRLDLRGLIPSALAALDAAGVQRLPVGCGNRLVPLGEFFAVAARGDDTLVIEGELARCDRIGWQLDGGTLHATGSVGDHAGGAMRAGLLRIDGDAAHLAGCEMSGGTLEVQGDVGDFAGGTLPGSMDGMRGGLLLVRGRAGQRFADRMRRGSALVFGDAGDGLASRLVAGTVAVGGRVGAQPGYGMKRGTLVFAGAAGAPPARFVPAVGAAPVFWQLLARDLQRHGGPFAGLVSRGVTRHLGDVAAGGKGEWIAVR